jgi:hypothetical protein
MSPTSMGRLLVGFGAVAAIGTGPVFGRTASTEAQRHPLMTDIELAAVLAAFVDTVRARPPKEAIPLEQLPGPLPAFRKRKPPR